MSTHSLETFGTSTQLARKQNRSPLVRRSFREVLMANNTATRPAGQLASSSPAVDLEPAVALGASGLPQADRFVAMDFVEETHRACLDGTPICKHIVREFQTRPGRVRFILLWLAPMPTVPREEVPRLVAQVAPTSRFAPAVWVSVPGIPCST
jgi:hypothetical protein